MTIGKQKVQLNQKEQELQTLKEEMEAQKERELQALKKEIEDEVVLHCAKLAKQYSKAKLTSKAGVIYTFRKNLKKPPASNLGYVTYKNETEILVD